MGTPRVATLPCPSAGTTPRKEAGKRSHPFFQLGAEADEGGLEPCGLGFGSPGQPAESGVEWETT
jgi:hypothetical protein